SRTAVDLTIDKKANDSFEIARILREGGFVSNGRVMGSLAVSRAIGDCQLKHPSKRILIPDPEVTTFKPLVQSIGGTGGGRADEFIVIATDGLWDVMTSQDAVDMVSTLLE